MARVVESEAFCTKRGYIKAQCNFYAKIPKRNCGISGSDHRGDFYVSVDEDMPGGRIQLILDNIQPPLVICDVNTIGAAQAFHTENCDIVLYDEIAQTQINDEALGEKTEPEGSRSAHEAITL